MNSALPTPHSALVTAPHSPLVMGTWDTARKWLTAARQFEQCKLYSQVMLGIELLRLHKEHGISNGGDRRSVSQIGKLIQDDDQATGWEDILHRETGLSRTTAYRIMDMARAALPRLKKLPGLSAFDPTVISISAIPVPEQKALEAGVKKLTDGRTQLEFCLEYGLAKAPQGSGATGRKPGEGGRRRLTLAEQAELLQTQAREDWHAITVSLLAYTAKFTALTDTQVEAQISLLEQALTARKTWLNQPQTARDPEAIANLFRVS